MTNTAGQADAIGIALSVALRSLTKSKHSGSRDAQIQDMERVLSIIELGCKQGFRVGELSIPAGQSADGPTICRIIESVQRQPVPHLRIVKPN